MVRSSDIAILLQDSFADVGFEGSDDPDDAVNEIHGIHSKIQCARVL